MYSDWNLEEKISKYFFGENPKFLTALDIGANDGVYLSNTRQIILDGWNAVLVDPAESAYKRLVELYNNHPKVLLCNVGIGTESKKEIFYESGSYQKWTTDTALFSTVVESEIKRFPGVSFETKEIELMTWSDFLSFYGLKHCKFDFISIDAEGLDWEILQQINLTDYGCRFLCVEWNQKPEYEIKFTNYVKLFGMKLHEKNNDNLVFVR
jgi:FkbM family methyltransferase